ncbi:MAG: DNA internalization-related competence protein ComEC/Rec2 [Francisellaceae bacterium]
MKSVFRHLNAGIIGLVAITIGLLSLSIVGGMRIYHYYQAYPESQLNKKIIIEGVVDSLPDISFHRHVFRFKTADGTVLLSAYPSPFYDRNRFIPGSRWRVSVKLKAPRGFKNPGVFDYGLWLKRQGISATGYILSKQEPVYLGQGQGYDIERWRYALMQRITAAIDNDTIRSVALALLIGDRSTMSFENKQLFQKTATSHLMVISGLHIALIALLSYWLVRFLWSCSISLCRYLPAQKAGVVAGMLLALFYSAIAGFSIPTVRALIMVVVIGISMMIYRKFRPSLVLFTAFVAVVLWNPFSIYESGFWLSFSAVAFLFYLGFLLQGVRRWSQVVLLQLLLSLLLIPLTIYWFGAFSIIGFVANVIAIPWVSFIVVPSLFIALGFSYLSINIWFVTEFSIRLLMGWLGFLASHVSLVSWHSISIAALMCAIFGILMLTWPLRWYFKTLALCFILPLFQPAIWPNQLIGRIVIFDVGQGLSSAVMTKDQTLVFDTGFGFTNGYMVANLTAVPYLEHQGISHINRMVISHLDADHSGGVAAFLSGFEIDQVIASVYSPRLLVDRVQFCQAGQSWQMGRLDLRFLNSGQFGGNNGSCVLKISYRGLSVLMTGDIEAKAEHELVKTYGKNLQSTVLIAPHHGSKTSSTTAFIDAVSPHYVIFSSGFHNRYGFPHELVVERYRQRQIRQYNTADSGAVIINIWADGRLELSTSSDESYQ